MLKTLSTILRAKAARVTEDIGDRNALAILDQQIRDGARALDAARHALAVTAARDGEERRRLRLLKARIDDLETRAIAALRDGAEDLAARAAETLADLEADHAAAQRSCDAAEAETARLAHTAKAAACRLAELDRGRRTAVAADAVQRLRTGVAALPSPLRAAEATLDRLRQAQREAEGAPRFTATLDAEGSADALCEALAASGYGEPTRPRAASVLARLKQASLTWASDDRARAPDARPALTA